MLNFNKIDDNGNARNIEDRKEGLWYKPVPVQGSDGKWGYKLGKMYYDELKEIQSWIIQPKYDKAWPFDPDLPIAQVKVDEEKSYIEYDPVYKDVILREELGPYAKKYPAYPYRDHATYSGPNFIKTTPDAQKYLNRVSKTAGDFYQIFKNAWFDYNDVSEILAKVIYDRSPNWGMTRYKTMNEIIAETEVWLITDDDAKKRVSIKVKNRFTGKEEMLTIPKDLGNSPVNKKNQDLRQWIERIKKLLYGEDVLKKEPMNEQNEADLQEIVEDLRRKLIWRIKELLQRRDSLKREQMNEQIKAKKLQEIEEKLRKLYKGLWGEDERTHTDWMGCYIPRTGTILIKIDSVDEAADLFGCPQDLLFQKVLLHEFIHAALDLWPRDAAGNISYHKKEWKTADPYGESFNEESIDNAIVLKLYKGTPGYRDVKGFIETQPYYYRRAVELDKSKLLFLLRDLIAYKISAPVSTTSVTTIPSTATSGKYTYYVNGHIVASGKRAGIGAAAYEVFKTIIPTLTLIQVRAQVIALVKTYGPPFGSLPLVIYNKSPKQTRYYKVPISTKNRQDIYLCSQWYDRHYNLLKNIVSAYPALFPGGINRK